MKIFKVKPPRSLRPHFQTAGTRHADRYRHTHQAAAIYPFHVDNDINLSKIVSMTELKELERENTFYTSRKTEFHEKYYNKWLVITGDTLWGVFDQFSDAAQAAFQNFKPGKFMIHTPSHDDTVIQIAPLISEANPTDNSDDDLDSGITATEGELVRFPYAC